LVDGIADGDKATVELNQAPILVQIGG